MSLRPRSHRFSALVEFWYPQRTKMRWVLASLLDARGSSYRKVGAQLFINDLGQSFGLISGGCLEAEIVRRAQTVFETGLSCDLEFDSTQWEDGQVAQTGCGGVLIVRLQALNEANHYLQLEDVYLALRQRQHGCYLLPWESAENDARWLAASAELELPARARKWTMNNRNWLATPLDLAPLLLLVGGGVDARPLAEMAALLGWRVCVCDPRVSAARRSDFSASIELLRVHPDELPETLIAMCDAAVVMTHNLRLDSEALIRLQQAKALRYLGLLGPAHRRARVLERRAAQEFACAIAGPAGLHLGGDLPESVALSIMAEAHAALHATSAKSFCRVLVQD